MFSLSINPTTKAYLSSGLDLANTSSLSIILSKAYPFAIVSTLKGLLVSLATNISTGQSHTATLQF